MSLHSFRQCFSRNRMARRNPDAKTAPTRSTSSLCTSPQSSCAYMLWYASTQSTASSGLV